MHMQIIKSNFNDFWVDVIKIGYCHLVHETLKPAEWVYELYWYFVADCDAITFGKTNIVIISLTFKCQFTAVLLG